MGKISIKAVLIGSIVDIVTSTLLAFPFVIYATSKAGVTHVAKDQIQQANSGVIEGSISLHVVELLIGLACSTFGGYVAAKLAKHDERLNGAFSSVLCVFLGIIVINSHIDSRPVVTQVALLLASPLFGLLGGYLRLQHARLRNLKSATK